MDPLRFENIYEILAAELERGADLVRLSVTGEAEALSEIAEKAFKNVNVQFILKEPLLTFDGSMPLLAAGSDLGAKIGSVISRQAKNPDSVLGPIILTPSESLVSHYRAKVLHVLAPAMNETKSNPSQAIGRVFKAVKPELRNMMDTIVEASVTGCLTDSNGLAMMLQITRNKGFESRWKMSIEACYLAMAIRSEMGEIQEEAKLKTSLERTGKAGLFQDLAVMLKPSLYSRETAMHPSRSAQMAEAMGCDSVVCELIGLHHTLKEEQAPRTREGEEEQKAIPARTVPPDATALVVANLFVSALGESKKSGADIEIIKSLNFMMAEGRLEKKPVTALTRLYLSNKFALFYEKATAIRDLCPHESEAEPVLWNILGERNPQKFICRYKDCPHLGSQQTLVSQTIPVVFDGNVVAKIVKGDYYSCPFLTSKLASLYKEVALLNTK